MEWLRRSIDRIGSRSQALHPIVSSTAWRSAKPDCGNDTLLVEPIREPGSRRSPEILAYGLDGVERARFAFGAPRSTGGFGIAALSRFTSAPGRVIVEYPSDTPIHFDQVIYTPTAVAILDVPTRTVTPLDWGEPSSRLTFGDRDAMDLPGSTSIAAVWRGQRDWFEEQPFAWWRSGNADAYLIDLRILQTRHFGESTVGAAVFSVAISPDSQLVAVGTSTGLLVGAFSPDQPLWRITKIGPIRGLAFSPDGTKLAFVVPDDASGTTVNPPSSMTIGTF